MKPTKNKKILKTFYTKEFYSRLKKTIGESSKFVRKNYKERQPTIKKLKELFLFADFTTAFTNDFKLIDYGFKVEMTKFKTLYKKELKQIIKAKNSASFLNNLEQTLLFIHNYSSQKGYVNNAFSFKSVIKTLDSNLIFYILLSTLISLINYDQTSLEFRNKRGINPDQVSKQTYHKALMTNLLTLFILQTTKNKELVSPVIIDLYHEIPNIIHGSDSNQSIFKLTHQLITLFIDAFELELETRKIHFGKTKRFTKVILIKVPSKILSKNIQLSHIPQLVKPDNTFEKIEDEIKLSKNVKNGISRASLSCLTKQALKVSQEKRFVVNKETIKLFKDLDTAPYEDIQNLDSLPFTPLTHLKFLKDRIGRLKSGISNKLLTDINECQNKYKTTLKTTDLDSFIMQTLSLTKKKLDQSRELYKLKKDYAIRIQLRVLHNTIIRFAELFEGFPIYFINSYDYRLRMYPWNYMFNRTSGNYKYLVRETNSFATKNGVELMILNYLKNHPEKIAEFNRIKDLCDEKQLVEWFTTNINTEELPKTRSFFYYHLLGLEIKKLVETNYRTGFLLEVDQKSSASVLLALTFGDSALAEQTNLIAGNDNKDVNTFIMNESRIWFRNKVSTESYQILVTNRDIHKYLFMGFIYNQTLFGRFKRIEKYISDDKDIKKIAELYPLFIESLFPFITKKKDMFNDIIKYYLKHANAPINLETLDGSLVKWQIFKKDQKNSRYVSVKNPITDRFENFKMNLNDLTSTNVKKTIAGMVPSFIHSVDAAIMRLIILDIYNTNGYVINHLHDSIQFHPSKYNSVRSAITNVYTSKVMNNILMDKLLIKLRNNLVEEHKQGFDLLIEKLYARNFTHISIIKEKFNVDGMFPFK